MIPQSIDARRAAGETSPTVTVLARDNHPRSGSRRDLRGTVAAAAVDDDDFAHQSRGISLMTAAIDAPSFSTGMTTAMPRGSIAGHNPGTALAGHRQ